MNHPLTPNLSDLSDADLANKITDLNKKLAAGYRFGNAQLVRQVQMLLNDYMEEQGRRTQEHIKKLQEQNDSGKNWDDIIDIK